MITQISSKELKNQLEEKKSKLILIDVREPWEFEITKINKSENIPLGSIATILNSHGLEKEIVVYCHHGVRSMRAANFLHSLGYKNVRNLTGGIDSYRSVDASVKAY